MNPKYLPKLSENLALRGSLEGKGGEPTNRFPWYYIRSTGPLVDRLRKQLNLKTAPELLTLIGPELSEAQVRDGLKPATVLCNALKQLTVFELKTLATGTPENYSSGELAYVLPPWLQMGPDACELDRCIECLKWLKEGFKYVPEKPLESKEVIAMSWTAVVNPKVLYDDTILPPNPSRIQLGVVRSALSAKTGDLDQLACRFQADEIWDETKRLMTALLKGAISEECVGPFKRLMAATRPAECDVFAALTCARAFKAVLTNNIAGLYPPCWDSKWNAQARQMLDLLRLAARDGVATVELEKKCNKKPSAIIRDLVRRGGDKLFMARELKRLRKKHSNDRYYLYRE